MESEYPQLLCPLCGTTKSVRYFDPSGFSNEVLGVRFRGLGRGRGFRKVSERNLLGSDHPVVGRISDRVAVLFDLFFEGDSVEELLDEICDELGVEHDTLYDACRDLLSRYQDHAEEEHDEEAPDASGTPVFDDDDVDDSPVEAVEPLSELGYELLRGEQEEDE